MLHIGRIRWTSRDLAYLTYMMRQKNTQIGNHHPMNYQCIYFRSMYTTTLHCCSVFLAHFLRSSICSTSLDSSTTLPFTIVCVTTFTIFRVLTSGSSAENQSSIDHFTWKAKYIIFYSTLLFLRLKLIQQKYINLFRLFRKWNDDHLLLGGGGISFTLFEKKSYVLLYQWSC